MRPRRCTGCGTPIAEADLGGDTVWIDAIPTAAGLFTIVWNGGDTPHIAATGTGRYQRHTCAAVDHPTNLARQRATGTYQQARAAADRSIAAIITLQRAGVQLRPAYDEVARARVAHPHDDIGALAARLNGVSKDAVALRLHRIRHLAKTVEERVAA